MDRNYPLLKLRGIGLLLVVPMILAGCGLSAPSPAITADSEMVGTWVAVDADESALLKLSSDGSAQFENIPRNVVSPSLVDNAKLNWALTVTTSGKWTTTDLRTSGYPYIFLSFESNEAEGFEGTTVNLLVDKTNSPMRVFLQYGPERESRLIFEKETI